MTSVSAWDEPTAKLRDIIDRMVRAPQRTAPPAELASVLDQLYQLVDGEARPVAELIEQSTAQLLAGDRCDDRSMIGGTGNPLAPPVRWVQRESVWRAEARLGMAYEGPPGRAHGGIVAAMLDHVLGNAQPNRQLRYTRTLTIDFLAPTPLYTDLMITARPDEPTGRKLWIEGEITAGGTVTARARGLWVASAEGMDPSAR